MSGHRTKRLFAGAASDPAQRQITKFFQKTSPDDSSAPPATTSSSSSFSSSSVAAASLPPSVQANLLSVGMRVRKSVPEGYKTGSASYGSFSLWSDADADADTEVEDSTTSHHHQHHHQHHHHVTTTSAMSGPFSSPVPEATRSHDRGAALSSRRELLPFCGIHKVGGLATQPEHDDTLPPVSFSEAVFASANGDGGSMDSDGGSVPPPPGLTSSQDTISSSQSSLSSSSSLSLSSYSNGGHHYYYHRPRPTAAAAAMAAAAPGTTNRKRLHTDTDRADHPVSFRDAWLDGEVSPRSVAPPPGCWETGSGPGGSARSRVLAVPKRRAQLAQAQGYQQQQQQQQQQQLARKRSGLEVGQENMDVMVMVVDEDDDGNRHHEAAAAAVLQNPYSGPALSGATGPVLDFEEATFLDCRAWGGDGAGGDMEMGGV